METKYNTGYVLIICKNTKTIIYLKANDIIEVFQTLSSNCLDYMITDDENIDIIPIMMHYDLIKIQYPNYNIVDISTDKKLSLYTKNIKRVKLENLLLNIKDGAGIYMIYNDTLEFKYIGSTKEIYKRIDRHFTQKYVGKHRLLHKDTKLRIIEYMNNPTSIELFSLEERYINKFNDGTLLNKDLYPSQVK